MAQRRVMVQMRVPKRASERRVQELADQLATDGFNRDPDYLIPLPPPKERERRFRLILLRGTIEEDREPDLEARSDVVKVWSDFKPEAFSSSAEEDETDQPSKSPFTFGF